MQEYVRKLPVVVTQCYEILYFKHLTCHAAISFPNCKGGRNKGTLAFTINAWLWLASKCVLISSLFPNEKRPTIHVHIESYIYIYIQTCVCTSIKSRFVRYTYDYIYIVIQYILYIYIYILYILYILYIYILYTHMTYTFLLPNMIFSIPPPLRRPSAPARHPGRRRNGSSADCGTRPRGVPEVLGTVKALGEEMLVLYGFIWFYWAFIGINGD